MIDRFIVKIIDNMISSDIISGDDKEAYIYAYTIMLEKVLTLITIGIIGIVLHRLVYSCVYLCFLEGEQVAFILKHLGSVL